MAHIFADRADAGKLLAGRLPEFDPRSTVVIALPRGGLPVAAEISRQHDLPLDIALVRKIGAPGQPELALAAVSFGAEMEVTINPEIARSFGLGEADIRALAEREVPELRRRQELYRGGKPPIALAGKTAVVVDDGTATGATARAALKLMRRRGAERIILALPVAPPDTIVALAQWADDLVCLQTPRPFFSVGGYFRNFDQVSDEEVIAIMREMDERQHHRDQAAIR